MWISGIHGSKSWSVRTKKFSRPADRTGRGPSIFSGGPWSPGEYLPDHKLDIFKCQSKNGYFTRSGQKVGKKWIFSTRLPWLKNFKSIESRILSIWKVDILVKNQSTAENWKLKITFLIKIYTKSKTDILDQGSKSRQKSCRVIVHDSYLQINWYYTRKKII